MIRNYIFFWTKTYKHKCPDGTIYEVYRNPNNAFPLALTVSKKQYEAVLKGLQGISEVGAKVINESNVNGLFVQIDKSNSSMMPKFRSAYEIFKTQPCKGYEKFVQMVEKIHNEHERLQNLIIKIEGLVSLATLAQNDKDHKNLVNLYASLVDELGGSGVPVVATYQIEESRELVRGMLKQNNRSA